MQLIGRYLVMSASKTVRINVARRCNFGTFRTRSLQNNAHPSPSSVKAPRPKDKTAGAVGIVKCADNHLLVVANWDAKALDFYASNGLPLDDDACRFTFQARWTNANSANKAHMAT